MAAVPLVACLPSASVVPTLAGASHRENPSKTSLFLPPEREKETEREEKKDGCLSFVGIFLVGETGAVKSGCSNCSRECLSPTYINCHLRGGLGTPIPILNPVPRILNQLRHHALEGRPRHPEPHCPRGGSSQGRGWRCGWCGPEAPLLQGRIKGGNFRACCLGSRQNQGSRRSKGQPHG